MRDETQLSLHFPNAVREIGFAVSTGLSNRSSEVDHAGAVFEVTTNTGDQGTLTLTDLGQGYSAWVSIASSTPFHTLKFVEPSGNIQDQYVGNIVACQAIIPGVPAVQLARTQAGTELSWSEPTAAGAYDVVQGDLSVLLSSGGDFTAALNAMSSGAPVCLANDSTAMMVTDTTPDPVTANGWFYLVRCDGGTYDRLSLPPRAPPIAPAVADLELDEIGLDSYLDSSS